MNFSGSAIFGRGRRLIAWRATCAAQTVRQYPWLYARPR
jgi:hypothetical protein